MGQDCNQRSFRTTLSLSGSVSLLLQSYRKAMTGVYPLGQSKELASGPKTKFHSVGSLLILAPLRTLAPFMKNIAPSPQLKRQRMSALPSPSMSSTNMGFH